MKIIPEFSTIQLLKQALARLGYSHETIVLGDENYTRFVSPQGKVWFTSNTHINYPFATSAARTISDKKHLSYELAATLGIRAPLTRVVNTSTSDYEKDYDEMLQAGPLVVKPDNSSLSRGLTLNVTDKKSLRAAVADAACFSRAVLVQEQVAGEEIRFVVLDGKVTAALLRQTPRLVGDGLQSIAQLLKAENEARARIQVPYLSYPQLAEPLVSFAGIDMEKIPSKGEVIELGRGTMIKSGASIYNVLTDIDPSYVQTAEKLANTLGKGFVVVDIFIEDYTKPQTADNYAFIEFNMSPVLKLCYSCRDGNNYEILDELAPMIDESLHKGIQHA